MFPKWINIRRGMVVCMLLGGWALCPWIIIKNGKTFLSFMGAYSIFMAPIAGILFCDYWLIKRRKYDVPALYDPHGIYYYRVSFPFNALQCMPKCQWDLLVELIIVWNKLACSSMYVGGHSPPSTRSRPCRDASQRLYRYWTSALVLYKLPIWIQSLCDVLFCFELLLAASTYAYSGCCARYLCCSSKCCGFGHRDDYNGGKDGQGSGKVRLTVL